MEKKVKINFIFFTLIFLWACHKEVEIKNPPTPGQNKVDPPEKKSDQKIYEFKIYSATASSDNGNIASNTIDDNFETYWEAQGEGSFLFLDLGNIKNIKEIKIGFNDGNTRQQIFSLEASLDGNTFSSILSYEKPPGDTLDLYSINLTNTSARYLKIIGHGNTQNDFNSFSEIKIYGSHDTLIKENPTYPSDLIPLEAWKITLPIDINDEDCQNITEVSMRKKPAKEQKDLINYQFEPYFLVQGDFVRFRAHCGGATTKGSYYPRSELRQTYNGGNNFWLFNHHQILTFTGKVSKVPDIKPEISVAQIHGGENDTLRVQYYGSKKEFQFKYNDKFTASEKISFNLNEEFTLKIEVKSGHVDVWFNGNQIVFDSEKWPFGFESIDDKGYFKAGAYTQSSMFLSQFKDKYEQDCNPEDYGEVLIKDLNLLEN